VGPVAWVVVFSRTPSRAPTAPLALGLGLLLGGAAGNLADRVLRNHHGAVIDFIAAARIGTHDWWPVFNIADATIVIGVVVLVASYWRGRDRRPAPPDG
jgi:signal peptidase II